MDWIELLDRFQGLIGVAIGAAITSGVQWSRSVDQKRTEQAAYLQDALGQLKELSELLLDFTPHFPHDQGGWKLKPEVVAMHRPENSGFDDSWMVEHLANPESREVSNRVKELRTQLVVDSLRISSKSTRRKIRQASLEDDGIRVGLIREQMIEDAVNKGISLK